MSADKQPETISALTKTAIWICRILTGATFIISGWAKAIDPWGFIYKIEEYLNVWGVEMPREITLTASIALSVVEFTTGIALLTGSIRRASAWLATIFILVMLPLTAYIAIANPVTDCGCFGDFIILSNPMTFAKNVVLAILIVYLLFNNHKLTGLYPIHSQWFAIGASICFACFLSYTGYRYQPLVDFRPYPTGSKLLKTVDDSASDGKNPRFIYQKDGKTEEFGLENLPDSTWTFVEAVDIDDDKSHRFVISDGENDVTEDVLDNDGDILILAVSDPGIHYLTRARLANELSAYMDYNGGKMTGIVAADGEALEDWKQMALPEYEVYTADDTDLKELVRGDAGLVFIRDGVIVWKRNLASISHDVLRDNRKSAQDDYMIPGKDILTNDVVTAIYLVIMLVAFIKIPNFAQRKKRLKTEH